jgi:type IV secretory pathway VirB2 component (pilin)
VTKEETVTVMKQWREKGLKLGALAALWVLSAPAAFATTGGTSMPWDEPLIRIQENLTGPVASAIIIIAVALAGVMWALSDHGTGMRRVSQVIFGAGVALGAVSFVTALGFSGAVL